jgi:PAS domain S-box-containing protein
MDEVSKDGRCGSASLAGSIDFRQLTDLATDPVVVHDGDRVVYANKAAADLVGAPDVAALLGASILDFVAPEHRQSVIERARQLTQRGGAMQEERIFVRLDGSRVAVETTGVALAEGRTLVVIRDVSRQVAAEQARREAELQLRTFIEGSADAIGIARDGRYVFVNEALASLFGYEGPEALIGEPVARVVAPAERERVATFMRQRTEGERAPTLYRTYGLRRDGTEFQLEVRATTHRQEGTTHAMAILRDITEERTTEARLREREKLEAVGRLAGGIAHDFNNILSGILGHAELSLLEVDRGSTLHDNQERIREAALRARALVQQILAFGQRDHANQRVVDVPTVVREALGLMRAGIPSTVTFEIRIDPDAGATLADPTQLHQIVLNLCANARDAVGPYGRIGVEVDAVTNGSTAPAGATPAGWVRLRVRDDGAGMDEETRARLFEPYMTTKGRSGGHGLGLAVVHGIVAAAGGVVRVDSAPDRGATFDVFLPRREAPIPAPAPPPKETAGRGERILLVEDEPLVRNTHRRVLESLGYSVELAENGEAALERFRQTPDAWDLILTDQSMPKLSGEDLARAVRELRPTVPVLLCTGYSDRLDEEARRALGVRAILQKPIGRDAMAEAIRAALEGA